jgi:hypothetical protein
MKKILFSLILFSAVIGGLSDAKAQGTLFTYQGQLQKNGAPLDGYYDMVFRLWTDPTAGSSVGPILTNTAVVVSNGLFTTTLDFGPVFDGTTLWLHIGVRTNTGGAFTPLTPRQQLTPTPYAITAENLDGTLPASQIIGPLPGGLLSGTYGNTLHLDNPADTFSGTFTGNGAALANVNALTLDGMWPSNFWSTTGNAGTVPGANFLGTTDNTPLDLEVYSSRGLHLEYVSRSTIFPVIYHQYGVNVIGGYWGNSIANTVIGGTIAGGGDTAGSLSLTSYGNTVSDDFGAVGGGYSNTAGYAAAVPGGYFNSATGAGSFAAGRYAHTANNGSFIWADGSINPFNSTAVNAFDVLASGGVFFYNGVNGVNIDQLNLNTNTINYGLRFGVGSGEGIGSARNGGNPNIYGLDFYTGFANRMTIQNDGSMRVYDNNIYLRGNTDPNHGIAYRSTVNGIFFDGPFVWGYNGGALGTVGPDEVSLKWDYVGNVWISNNCSVATLTIRGGADLAEPFKISPGKDEVPQGAVVVIDENNPGHLTLSDLPYDTRVAGVVSGANGVNPGIQMQQQGLLEGDRNVALSGRVYVQADASYGAIKPGDLLTTSATPGYAMKVSDHGKAQGAILGKAMTGLKDGKGTVLVLVTLQ